MRASPWSVVDRVGHVLDDVSLAVPLVGVGLGGPADQPRSGDTSVSDQFGGGRSRQVHAGA